MVSKEAQAAQLRRVRVHAPCNLARSRARAQYADSNDPRHLFTRMSVCGRGSYGIVYDAYARPKAFFCTAF